MDIKNIVILEEAAQDMRDGKVFYEMQTQGWEITFGTVLLQTLNHFIFMLAFMNYIIIYSGCYRDDFPTLFTTN